MITVKSKTGDKQQRSEVVKGKNIQEAFPITMLEHHRNWKLKATLPNFQDGKRHFDLVINGKSFFNHDFAPQV